jgi:type I restriction enzyme S subunit
MSEEQVSVDEVVDQDSSDIDNEWQKIELGELAKYQNGNAFRKSEWTDSGYPIIRIQNLTGEQEEFNYFDGELEDRYRVTDGDTLLSWSATIDIFEWRGPEAALNQHIYRIDTTEKVNDIFFRFKLEELLSRLESLSHGSTMKHVRKADLVNLSTDIPPLEEQRKIASVLYTVDQAIQKTQEIIGQIQQFKKGLMQDLFVCGVNEKGNLRNSEKEIYEFKKTPLGRIPKSWECVRLEELIERFGGFIQTGPFGSQLHKEEYVTDGVPVVMPQNIQDGKIIKKRISQITSKKSEDLARHKMQPNDVVIARRGDLERAASITEREEGWICGTGCLLIRPPREIINGQWLRMVYQHPLSQHQINSRAVGSTMSNLNQSILENLQLALPPIEEQEKIVRTFSDVSTRVNNEREYLSHLNNLKNGLMQDLLSGTVRTIDTNIMVLDEILTHD